MLASERLREADVTFSYGPCGWTHQGLGLIDVEVTAEEPVDGFSLSESLMKVASGELLAAVTQQASLSFYPQFFVAASSLFCETRISPTFRL